MIKVAVTQADIDAGVPNDGGSCPVALALQRFFNADVSVGTATCAVLDRYENPTHRYMLNPGAGAWIDDFDAGGFNCPPFVVKLEEIGLDE